MTTSNRQSRAGWLLTHMDSPTQEAVDDLVRILAPNTGKIDRTTQEALGDLEELLQSINAGGSQHTRIALDACLELVRQAEETTGQSLEDLCEAQNTATQQEIRTQDLETRNGVLVADKRRLEDQLRARQNADDRLGIGASWVNPRPSPGAFTEGCRYLVANSETGVISVAWRGPNDQEGKATWRAEGSGDTIQGEITVLRYLNTAEEIREKQEDAELDEHDFTVLDELQERDYREQEED